MEIVKEAEEKLQELYSWRDRLMIDVVADDFEEGFYRLQHQVMNHMAKYPQHDTETNRKIFRL